MADLKLTKRGNVYYFDRVMGGVRIKASLGVRNPQAARTLCRQIESARAEGPKSEIWATLRVVLPPASFKTVSTGFRPLESPEVAEFARRFEGWLDRRVKLGEIAEGTRRLYEKAARIFFNRMGELKVQLMDQITPRLVEEYIIWRKTSIQAKGTSGRGVATEITTLQSVFNFALEEGTLRTSPLRTKFTPEFEARGAEPFSPEELSRLEANLDDTSRLPFLLLRNTGLRGGDAADLTWASYDPAQSTLKVLTRKRKKTVTVPLTAEFNQVLTQAYLATSAASVGNKILPGMTRRKLYGIMADLGKRTGVENCRPHRFRDTLAVTILAKGGTIYDVARVLGDTVATVDKFYTPFTNQLQDRVREILEKP